MDECKKVAKVFQIAHKGVLRGQNYGWGAAEKADQVQRLQGFRRLAMKIVFFQIFWPLRRFAGLARWAWPHGVCARFTRCSPANYIASE